MRKKKHLSPTQMYDDSDYVAEVIEVIGNDDNWNKIKVKFLKNGKERILDTHKIWKVNKKEYWAREVIEE